MTVEPVEPDGPVEDEEAAAEAAEHPEETEKRKA